MEVKKYSPLNSLKKIADNLWIVDGEEVLMDFKFFKVPFSTRMTVIRLQNGGLWVHSPTKPNDNLLFEIKQLGEVKHLIAPNVLHYSYIDEWHQLFPEAKVWLASGVQKRARKSGMSLDYGQELSKANWNEEILFTTFEGSFYVKEVVFFHNESSTLILTDLIENIETEKLSLFEKLLFKIGDNHYPNGKTPRDLRISFLFGKKQALRSYHKIKKWEPKNIIISHGPCIIGQAKEMLKQAFFWLEKYGYVVKKTSRKTNTNTSTSVFKSFIHLPHTNNTPQVITCGAFSYISSSLTK